MYESIVSEFPEEAEAYWGLCLCKFGIEYVDDPATGKKIPTCHRTAYDSIFEDSNFEQALEWADSVAHAVYRAEAKEIDRLQKEILEIAKNEQPFDVFICYKESDENGQRTVDSELAHDIYDVLTEKGYKVFYSRITLKSKLGQDYEPYIFSALNSAKVMLAVGTKYEYYNAVWVKNEWSRYLALMSMDNGKTLIPCYRDIDAYDMPKEFKHLQAQDLSSPRAFQDLVSNIEKIISLQTSQPEKVVVKEIGTGSPTANSLIKRAMIFLGDGDFVQANTYAEKVLDADPENANAYLIKLCSDMKALAPNELAKLPQTFENNKNYQKAFKFGNKKMQTDLQLWNESIQKNLMMSCLIATIKKIYKKNLLSITTFSIPNSVISIEDMAFYKCVNLISITIPDSVTSIGVSAFEKCTSLTSIAIPNSVNFIGNSAFSNCTCLTSIIIPDGAISIGYKAFCKCGNLTSITIPDSVTSIGAFAFAECTSLTSIAIPNNVSFIGNSAFSNCTSLTSIIIPNGVISIENEVFCNCGNLTSITIPDSVTSIGAFAFAECTSLTSIAIPNSVSFIGNSAFSNCTSLTSIIIPNSVTSIGAFAFSNCTNLTSIIIPNSVTSIDTFTFSGCNPSLEVIIPDHLHKSLRFTRINVITQSQKIEEEAKRRAEEEEKIRRKAEEEKARIRAEEEKRCKAMEEERCKAEMAAKQKAEEEFRQIQAMRRSKWVCQHCGGAFKGLFSKKCSVCGKPKDY